MNYTTRKTGILIEYEMAAVMFKGFLIASAFAAGFAFGISTPAKAALITYSEEAILSGSLDGVSYSNKLVEIKATGDSARIWPSPSVPGVFFLTDVTDPIFFATSLTFSVSGVGSGTFADDIGVLFNQNNGFAGFSDFTTNRAILGTVSGAFGLYDLSTSIGPITGGITGNSGFAFSTSAGALVFSYPGNSTSTFAAAVAPIPEPSTWAMLLIGFAGLGFIAYRRSKPALMAA